jgi:hypothetical protein
MYFNKIKIKAYLFLGLLVLVLFITGGITVRVKTLSG